MELPTVHDETSNVVAKVQVTVTFDIDELRLKAKSDDDAKSRAEELIGKLLEQVLCNETVGADDLTCEVEVKGLDEPCPSFCTEYTVASQYLSYFINGDASGISNAERKLARMLEDQLGSNGHWSYPCTVAAQEEEFGECDITGAWGTCSKLWWVDMEEVRRLASEEDKARAEGQA